MQQIVDVGMTPEEYVKNRGHERVAAPVGCPNPVCRNTGRLHRHMKYERGLSGLAGMFGVMVFLCEACRQTVSCLPSFALPYRYVRVATVEAFLRGETGDPEVRRHERLLSCAGLDTRNLLSLALIGDENLLPRLELGINHALLQRMGYQVQLAPMTPQQSKAYIESRLKEVGLHTNPFEDAALDLLVNGADGIPRCLNLIAQAAMQQALENSSHSVTTKHVQKALEQLRWLAPNHIP